MHIPGMKNCKDFSYFIPFLGLIPVKCDSALDEDSRNTIGEYHICTFSIHLVPFI